MTSILITPPPTPPHPIAHRIETKNGTNFFFKRKLLEKALYTAFLACDRSIRASQDANTDGDRSGSTAVASFITPTHVVLAHAGDSRAVLAREQKVKKRKNQKEREEGKKRRKKKKKKRGRRAWSGGRVCYVLGKG